MTYEYDSQLLYHVKFYFIMHNTYNIKLLSSILNFPESVLQETDSWMCVTVRLRTFVKK